MNTFKKGGGISKGNARNHNLSELKRYREEQVKRLKKKSEEAQLKRDAAKLKKLK